MIFEEGLPMALKMIVTVKQVPDTQNITGEAMTPEGTVNRRALTAVTNPEDLNALDAALRVKDELGGSITVITIGPPSAAEVLLDCFYRNADELILLSDKAFAGSDTLATSFILKSAIEKLKPFDLIFCGRQAIDGDTAQVGPQLAEKLKINQLTRVQQVLEVSDKPEGCITVKRSTDYGVETLQSGFPVLLTITGDANIPRPPDIHRVFAFRDMPFSKDGKAPPAAKMKKLLAPEASRFKIWTNKTLEADPARCGTPGSPTKVKTIESIVLSASGARSVPAKAGDISELIHELKDEHIIG